jgi:argininosuccinate lyase
MGSSPFLENLANVRDVYVRMESMIGDIPWGIGYCSEEFGLISLDDRYSGLSSTAPSNGNYE